MTASTYSWQCMTYSWIGRFDSSIRWDERWNYSNYSTCKPSKTSHCQRISKTWHHDMPQHSAILRSPSHTPGLGPLGTNLGCQWQIDVRDGPEFIFSASAKAWKRQQQIKVGVCHRGPYRTKPDFWNAQRKHDIQLRHVESLRFKTWKNNPEIHGFMTASTYSLTTVWRWQMDWEYLTTQFDPRWTMKLTVTTAPANHPNFSLLEDFENMTSWHAAAFSDSAEPTTHQALAPSAPM